MSENELKRYITNLKRWFYGVVAGAILSIGSSFFVSWQSSIVNTEKISTIEKVQSEQQEDIDSKASVKMVMGIKEDLKEDIQAGFKAQNDKLDLLIRLSK